MGNWLAAERVAGPELSYPTQAKRGLNGAPSLSLQVQQVGVSTGNWLVAERVVGPEPLYPTQAKRGLNGAPSLSLDRGEAAHLAVFQGEMLATPGYGVSCEAPDPDT